MAVSRTMSLARRPAWRRICTTAGGEWRIKGRLHPSDHGLARLLEELERFALGHGDEWLYLDTNDSLQAAIAFYERNGYFRCARYNENPQATIFMRKKLPSRVQAREEPRP